MRVNCNLLADPRPNSTTELSMRFYGLKSASALLQSERNGEREAMATEIKFGTSGWRAVVADEFTVANVKRAITGIARYVGGTGKTDPKLVVGRDPRYMGETFVNIAATVLKIYGIASLVISEPAPTPAIAWEVMRQKADGAINFTASHNPADKRNQF